MGSGDGGYLVVSINSEVLINLVVSIGYVGISKFYVEVVEFGIKLYMLLIEFLVNWVEVVFSFEGDEVEWVVILIVLKINVCGMIGKLMFKEGFEVSELYI